MAWFAGYPREKIEWYPTINEDKCVKCGMCMNCGQKVYKWTDDVPVVANPYKCVVGCTTCATLCQGNAISFPDKELLRKLYKKERIWAKVKKELKEEGRLEVENTTTGDKSGRCEVKNVTSSPVETSLENQGCGCGGSAEPDESLENLPEQGEEDNGCGCGSVDESMEDNLDKVQKEGGCGCGCGGDYADESVENNPDNPKTMADEDFMEKLENYAHSIGITSIGYTKVPPELINEDKSILFPNAIVLTMEMDDDLIKTDPGVEAQALNDAHYEKLGNMTYQIADYLRENGFAAESAHPYGGVVRFSPLAQEAGLGWVGQSGLLITPASGPRQKISAIFTSIENLPVKNDDEHSWITEYCEKCGKCIKACPENALIEIETCCGGQETKFMEERCIGCSEGCTYCIEDCPFDQKEYTDIKNRFDKMNAKLAERKSKSCC